MSYSSTTDPVIPAKAGIQSGWLSAGCPWIPAFAGMTRLFLASRPCSEARFALFSA